MEITEDIEDGPYGWKAGFSWKEDHSAFHLTIRIDLQSDASTQSSQLKVVQRQIQREFARYFDAAFLFQLINHDPKPVKCDLEFTDDSPHLISTLSSGAGETQLTQWYTNSLPIHFAHELGHQLGLIDEYWDIHSPHRKNIGGEGIFHDHSLMGNYLQEGWKYANLRLRHGQQIASLITRHTTVEYLVSLNPVYQICEGDGLSWIAQRFLGSEDKWIELYESNRTLIPHRDVLKPGTLLHIPYS